MRYQDDMTQWLWEEQIMQGCDSLSIEDTDGTVYSAFYLSELGDYWREVSEDTYAVVVWQDDQGFINSSEMNRDGFNEFWAEIESDVEEASREEEECYA